MVRHLRRVRPRPPGHLRQVDQPQLNPHRLPRRPPRRLAALGPLRLGDRERLPLPPQPLLRHPHQPLVIGRLGLARPAADFVRLDRVQGHTRGTQTVRVSERDTTLFFSSDFMPDRHHLPLPWIPAFDLYPLDTLAAKKLIQRRAIDERWIVGFTHDLPRFGRISEAEGKLRFDEVEG